MSDDSTECAVNPNCQSTTQSISDRFFREGESLARTSDEYTGRLQFAYVMVAACLYTM